jgi:hypothetical protein
MRRRKKKKRKERKERREKWRTRWSETKRWT